MRSEVIATARRMAALGLVVESQGNVSAREGDEVWITARGVPYDVMTEDDVVPLGDERASSEWRVHAAIYAARPDVGAIVHTHSRHAIAWTARDEPLGRVPVAPFAPTGTDALAINALEALQRDDAVLLAKHGVVGVGRSLADALAACERVEEEAARRATP